MRPIWIFAAGAVCIAASAGPAPAQDAFVPPVSTVYARQVLMDEIEAQLGPADAAAIGDEFDLAAAQRGASAASAMLTAAPYLFDEGTDLNATADDDFPSLARPEVWRSFEAFRTMSDRASQMAFDLALVADVDAFRAQAAELRAVCNACHAIYMQIDETPF